VRAWAAFSYGCNARWLRVYSPQIGFVNAITVVQTAQVNDGAIESEPRKAHLRVAARRQPDSSGGLFFCGAGS